MSQGAFNFKYVQSKNTSGQTAHAGLGVYFDLFEQIDFPALVDRSVNISGDQGWCEWQPLLYLLENIGNDIIIGNPGPGGVRLLFTCFGQPVHRFDSP